MTTKTKPHNVPDLPEFQQYQFAFTRHIRDPQHQPRPSGVTARRMKIYNELLYNNLESFLLACFPVTRKVLGVRKWARLVRDFFTVHRCRTPLFRQIPDEFIHYLQQERGEHAEDPVFLKDLAHYEWIELVLSISSKKLDTDLIDPQGDMLEGRPAINPVLSLQSYAYPMHRISPRFKPAIDQQEATHFVLFRDAQDQVKFVLINPMTMRLLFLLQSGACTGKEALVQISTELNHPDPALIIAGGREILYSLHQAQAVLGTWKST